MDHYYQQRWKCAHLAEGFVLTKVHSDVKRIPASVIKMSWGVRKLDICMSCSDPLSDAKFPLCCIMGHVASACDKRQWEFVIGSECRNAWMSFQGWAKQLRCRARLRPAEEWRAECKSALPLYEPCSWICYSCTWIYHLCTQMEYPYLMFFNLCPQICKLYAVPNNVCLLREQMKPRMRTSVLQSFLFLSQWCVICIYGGEQACVVCFQGMSIKVIWKC